MSDDIFAIPRMSVSERNKLIGNTKEKVLYYQDDNMFEVHRMSDSFNPIKFNITRRSLVENIEKAGTIPSGLIELLGGKEIIEGMSNDELIDYITIAVMNKIHNKMEKDISEGKE